MAVKPKLFSGRQKARILVVDDHPIVRYGISRMLNMEPDLLVCGEAEDGNRAMEAVRSLKPDMIILDISLKDFDGLKLTKIIRADFPDIPVLILSMHDEMLYAKKALRSGASGYIMKEESSDKLVTAVRQVLKGEIYASDNVKKNVLQSYSAANAADQTVVDALSDRERQIFMLFGMGHTCKAIAQKLRLSAKTVETHRSRIKLKLGIDNTPQLVLAAAEWTTREGLSPKPS